MKTLILIILFSSSAFCSCGVADALTKIRPGAEWALQGQSYSGLQWIDTVQAKPTQKEIDTAISDCQAREVQEKLAIDQAKIDLNTRTKTDTQRIDAIIKYLQLDK